MCPSARCRITEPRFLTPAVLVAYIGGALTESTLANRRAKRLTPADVKVGAKVLYPWAEVDAWLATNTVQPAPRLTSVRRRSA